MSMISTSLRPESFFRFYEAFSFVIVPNKRLIKFHVLPSKAAFKQLFFYEAPSPKKAFLETKKKLLPKKIKHNIQISYAGRLEKENNPEFFIKIAYEYLKYNNKAIFNIFGDENKIIQRCYGVRQKITNNNK